MFERPQLSSRLSTAAGYRWILSFGWKKPMLAVGVASWLNETTRVEMVDVAEHLKLMSPEDQGVHRWIGEIRDWVVSDSCIGSLLVTGWAHGYELRNLPGGSDLLFRSPIFFLQQ
jgi:hypothetical protein